jgi:hypothetical protein
MTTAPQPHTKKAGDIPAFLWLWKIFHNIFYYFLPHTHPYPAAGAQRARAGHGFSGSRGALCPVFARAAIYFVFPGADVKLSKTVWALPFLAMSGYDFITTV